MPNPKATRPDIPEEFFDPETGELNQALLDLAEYRLTM